MKKDEPKLASCIPKDVFSALKRIGGFQFHEGAKHTKVTHVITGKSSTIPRHGTINRHLMKGFVEDYLVKDVGLTKDEYLSTFGVSAIETELYDMKKGSRSAPLYLKERQLIPALNQFPIKHGWFLLCFYLLVIP